MILDGWGIAQDKSVSAIDQAKTPYIDSLYTRFKHNKLTASGLAVGLPEGQMGNSEVGHMNLGAGRVVYQDLVKVNKAVDEKTIRENEVLKSAFSHAKEKGKSVHFIGLVSDGGVHSHVNHLLGLCDFAQDSGVEKYFVHAFTDGRDCDPKSGSGFLQQVENHLVGSNGKVASVVGRYFAMDRDKRWERVKLAYDLLVKGEGTKIHSSVEGINQSYSDGVTDEFIKPLVCVDKNNQPIATINEGDVVVCFNFRTDRGREITMVLTQEDYPEFGMKKIPLKYITLTNYDDTFKGVEVVFTKDNLNNTLGEVLEQHGKKQIRIAETEKYPHVTFFFSGGRETPFNGESRLLCPSPKVATYDLQPEMSAWDITDKIVPELKKGEVDFVCLNFANPDMVGHTGVFEAAVKACETVDKCAEKVIETALENNYATIVIADHGNSDMMINPDGTPNTAHTTNLVPFILADNSFKGELLEGKLGDMAPSILYLMGITPPAEMTGNNLIN